MIIIFVSILVLMEMPLKFISDGAEWFCLDVSILVLMEMPLKSVIEPSIIILLLSFNPCFDGNAAEISNLPSCLLSSPGFNPCFDGNAAEIRICSKIWQFRNLVSILVLMEMPLKFNNETLEIY